jgi:ABC-type nickel/cobalt efflux system permease component RcnA
MGLILTALALGLRHGIDWDHIAAIVDLTGTAETRRRGFVLSFIYAVGHAFVVFVLGIVIIAFGATIPESVDGWMSRFVGLTLIGLGTWIIVELIRKGHEFRLRSRWMLVIDGTFAGLRRVRGADARRRIAVEHAHDHEHVDRLHEYSAAHDHAHLLEMSALPETVVSETVVSDGSALAATGSVVPRHHLHRHAHRHEATMSDDARYGNGAAAGIGMLHGVGIESPTQIALFVASTSIVGVASGVALLGAWVLGLVVANSVLAVLAGCGLLRSDRSFAIYAALGVALGLMSIAMGLLFVVGLDVLPAIPT